MKISSKQEFNVSTDDQPLSHEQVAAYYDQVYYRSRSGDYGRLSKHFIRLAIRLGIQPGHQVLDIACGRGDWLAAAAARGAEVTGIDISARAIDCCRQRLPKAHLETGPAETLPFPNARFDRVTCLGSLEHFLDQPAALLEMRRVVKLSGWVVILVPNAGFLTYRLQFFRGTQQQTVKETIRPLYEWEAMFRSAGLNVVERWKDLHVLNLAWLLRSPRYLFPVRLAQALALVVWPLDWQYQVYHRCIPSKLK